MNRVNKQYITTKGVFWLFYILGTIALSLCLLLPYPLNFIPILIPFAVISIIVIIRYPFLGLLIYSMFFLIRPQEFLSILSILPIPLEFTTVIILLATLAFKLKREKDLTLSFTSVDMSILFFMFITFLSMLFSAWFDLAWEAWYKLFSNIIVFFMIALLVESKKQLQYFIYFIIFTSVFHAGTSILNYYTGTYEYRMGIKRAIGMDLSYGSPNSLAATLAYTLPFLYYTFTTHKRFLHKALTISFALLMLWCIILTGSRTGMAGVIFVSIYLMWQNKNKILNILMLFLIGLTLWVVMPAQYQERFLSTTDVSSDTGAATSAQGRIDGLVNGFLLMLDKPAFGFGVGCFGIANGSIYGRGYYQAHSLPGQLMGEIGILGIFAFICWMFYLFKNLNKVRRYEYADDVFTHKVKYLVISLKAQLLSLFFFGLGGHNLYRFNWFIISALIVVLINIKRDEDNVSKSIEL